MAKRLNTLAAVLAAAGFAAAAGPTLAQTTVGEITVMGRMGPDGEPQSLSRVVSFADLDLRNDAGVDMLKSRVRDTARDLCAQLGESGPSYIPLVPSCEQAAVADAMGQAKIAIAQAREPGAYAAYMNSQPAAPYAGAAAATSYAPPASADVSATTAEPTYTTTTVTNGPVPDTAANRARFGGPMSHAGKRTAPAGN